MTIRLDPKKFSEYPPVSVVDGTEIIPIVKDGENGAVEIDTIWQNGPGGGNIVHSVNGQSGVVELDTGDIPDTTGKHYVTDTEKDTLDNISGVNTGDQDLSQYETSTQLNARDTANKNRVNHTGVQSTDTISDLDVFIDAQIDSQLGDTIASLVDGKAPINNPTFTGTVTLPADPVATMQAATKQYVDSTAAAATPDATTTTKGRLQLAGDLSGTAALPTVPALATKVNASRTVNGHALSADVVVTKSDVGLGNADNTSDAAKPVSTAQQAAIDVAATNALNADNHIDGLTKVVMTVAERTKLSTLGKMSIVVGPTGSEGYITDSVADDVQIKAAIVAVASAGGGLVEIQAGTFNVNSAINPKPGVWLRGAGMFATKLVATSTLPGSVIADTSSFSSAAPLEGFIISDLEIDGHNMPTTPYSIGRKGLDSKFWRRCVVQNLYIHNTPATGFGVDNLDRCLVDHVFVKNCGTPSQAQGSNGIGIGTGGMVNESFVVTNCITENIANSAYLCEELDSTTVDRHYIFANNLSYNDFKGFSNSGALDLIIANNQIYNSTDDAIRVLNFSSHVGGRTTIIGNQIERSGSEAIYLDTSVSDCKIDNNLIRNGTIEAIVVRGSNHSITNNHISGFGKHGIFVGAASGGTAISNINITGNFVYDNSAITANTDGIRLDAAQASISDVLINGNRVFDSKVTKTQRYGLIITGSNAVTRVSALGNNFNGNKTADYFNNASSTTNVIYRDNAAQTQSAAYVISDVTSLQTALDGKEPIKGSDDNFVTDAEKIVIANTSGTNTGDNATNSQYSGLAASKQNTITGLTADGAELNILDGATVTTTELNYVHGVTSAVQTQLTDKASKTAANTYTAGAKQTVSHDSTTAGFSLGNVAGNPSTPAEGDVWYNSTVDTVVWRAGAANRSGVSLDAIQTLSNKTLTTPVIQNLSSAPTYVKGALYFDTTLNKLRVGGATGWETITST